MECPVTSAGPDNAVAAAIEMLCDQHPDAMVENPEMVYFMAQMFYEFRKQDFSSAAERLTNYLVWRKKLFGDLGSHSVEAFPSLSAQVETMFMRILPERLSTGEAVIYLEMKRHQPTVYSAEHTLQTWHYLILATMRQFPELAREGFVLTGNMTDASYENLDLGIPEAVASAVSNCMPVRMTNFFLINPPFILRMVIPVIKLILSSKMGHRLNVITDVSALYNEHGMDQALFPDAIGGVLSFENTKEFMNNLLSKNIYV